MSGDDVERIDASQEVHEAILLLASAKNHDDTQRSEAEVLDRITDELRVVRRALQYQEVADAE